MSREKIRHVHTITPLSRHSLLCCITQRKNPPNSSQTDCLFHRLFKLSLVLLNSCSKMSGAVLFNVIGYILVLVALFFVVKAEVTDMRCPNPNCSKDECGDYGRGMAYYGSEPQETDDIPKLLDRILVASKTDERTVKWRRCFILSFLVVTGICLLVLNQVPPVLSFVLMLFISMAVWHFSFGYYAFHHYQAAMDNVNKTVDILRQKTENCN
ncbi:putative membrane protein [Golden Marseillevirus]|uniref:hypothetical protein n=1 Tax=Golden Marseillevirus TaxID=1720526 RepID=UPI000877AADC|nr:hypothetical protein GMAR_ORF183 [Golden Marseillevirus]ALX27557.1 putative membrane protein [Golden Marseillevirus]